MRLSTDYVGGFERVKKKVQYGQTGCDDVVHFIRKHATVEREYAKALQKLVDHSGLPAGKLKKFRSVQQGMNMEVGTMLDSWDTIKTQIMELANQHNALADQLCAQSADPLAAYMQEKSKPSMALINEGTKLTGDLNKALANFNSAKAACEKLSADIQTLRSKPSSPENAKQLQKLTQKVNPTENSYNETAVKLNNTVNTYYGEAMPRVLNELEEIEMGRADQLKASFTAYSDALAQTAPVYTDCGTNVLNSVQLIDPQADLDLFIQNDTEEQLVVNLEVETFQIIVKEEGLTAEQMQALASQYKAGEPVAAPAAAAPPPAADGYEQPQVIGRAQALYDYDAGESNELTFREGDILEITYRHDDGWLEAVFNGQVGLAPSSFVQEI